MNILIGLNTKLDSKIIGDDTGLPKVDYHCHISITEYSDPRNPTVIQVSREEFLADLQEAGIDKAIILSDRRTNPEQVSEFVKNSPDHFIGFGYFQIRRDTAQTMKHWIESGVRCRHSNTKRCSNPFFSTRYGFRPCPE